MSDWWCDDTVYNSSPTFPDYYSQPRFTAELREFFDQYYVDPMTTAESIEAGRAHLFDFTYPLYNAAVKKDFETGIIRQFFFREIGFDTFGIFKFRLENWLNLNMPYFNKMYESIPFEDEKSPLDNTHRNETYTKTVDRDNTVAINDLAKVTAINDLEKVTDSHGTNDRDINNTANTFNRDIVSNTPDTRLQITTGVDGAGVIEYASQIDEHKSIDTVSGSVDDISTANTTETTNGSTTETTNGSTLQNDNTLETFTQEAHGKIGIQSYAKMLKDYRENLARVDKMLYTEMNELFMLLY